MRIKKVPGVFFLPGLSTRWHKYGHVLGIDSLLVCWHNGTPKGGVIMPRQSPYDIVLVPEERSALNAVVRQYTLPYFKVMRAKTVLLAAQGLENKEIGQRLDLPREIVSKWRKRFFYERLAGLQDRPRRGRPRAFSP